MMRTKIDMGTQAKIKNLGKIDQMYIIDKLLEAA